MTKIIGTASIIALHTMLRYAQNENHTNSTVFLEIIETPK